MLKRIILGIAVLASFVPLASFAEYPEKPVEQYSIKNKNPVKYKEYFSFGYFIV